jgi:hypothetical protein
VVGGNEVKVTRGIGAFAIEDITMLCVAPSKNMLPTPSVMMFVDVEQHEDPPPDPFP